jgi:hypothetical protein
MQNNKILTHRLLKFSIRFLTSVFLTSTTFAGVVPSDAELLVDTDFSKAGWTTPDWWGPSADYLEISLQNTAMIKRVKDPAGSDNTVLKWPITKGTHSTGRFMSKEINRRDVWASYRIYIPESVGHYDIGTDQDDSNKLPGPFGGGRGSGNYGATNGHDGWGARVGWKVDFDNTFRIGYYTYHMDRELNSGDFLEWNVRLERQHWYTITQHIVVNTLGEQGANADGVLEAWIDDQPVYSRKNLRFTDVPDFSAVRAFWLTCYFGGNKTAPHDMDFYFDDFKIYGMPEAPAAVLESIYPNPIAANSEIGKVKITVNETAYYKFKVTSVDGGLVVFEKEGLFEKGEQVIEVPFSNLASGVYIPWLTFGGDYRGGSGSEKIVNHHAKWIVVP